MTGAGPGADATASLRLDPPCTAAWSSTANTAVPNDPPSCCAVRVRMLEWAICSPASQLVGPLMLRFSGIVSDSEGGIAGLRERLIGGRPTLLDAILDRAAARGELDRHALPRSSRSCRSPCSATNS